MSSNPEDEIQSAADKIPNYVTHGLEPEPETELKVKRKLTGDPAVDLVGVTCRVLLKNLELVGAMTPLDGRSLYAQGPIQFKFEFETTGTVPGSLQSLLSGFYGPGGRYPVLEMTLKKAQ